MFRTDNQQALIDAFAVMSKDEGPAFVAGYATTMAEEMLNLLPKRKQKEFIKRLEQHNGAVMVPVKSLMSGAEVMIRRCERGGPCDPSMERYWSM